MTKSFDHSRMNFPASTRIIAIAAGLCLAFGLPSMAFAIEQSDLAAFDSIVLGKTYDELAQTNSCDKAADAPGLPGSAAVGLASTICPAAETFALATLLDQKVVSVAVNWVSWNAGQLLRDPKLSGYPAQLRKTYGIPSATISYESQFGNREADALCHDKSKQCQIHIWKTNKPERIASLVYAKVDSNEVPLLFSLSDINAEKSLKERASQFGQHPNKTKKNDEKIAH